MYILSMAVDDFTDNKMVDRYGSPACKEANKLEDTGISDGTINTYKPQVRQIISKLEPNPSPRDVIDHIKDTDKSSSTKNTMVMAIRKYYQALDEFGKSEELSQLSKKEDLSGDDHTTGMSVDSWVTVDETMWILDNLCPDEGEVWCNLEAGSQKFMYTLEHKALVATLYYTGLRVSEALMLKLEDFDFDNNSVEVYRLKKGGDVVKRDTIHQTDEYLDIIKDYASEYKLDETDNIFEFSVRTAENRIDDIEDGYNYFRGEFENCDSLTPHKFRHARVSSIANASGLEAASAYVDHESLETTKAYRHMTTDEQKDILPESDEKETEDGGVNALLNELDVDSVEELKEKLD